MCFVSFFFGFNWKLLKKINFILNSELINNGKNVGRKLKYSELGLKSGSVVENVVVVFYELHETYLVLASIDRNGSKGLNLNPHGQNRCAVQTGKALQYPIFHALRKLFFRLPTQKGSQK